MPNVDSKTDVRYGDTAPTSPENGTTWFDTNSTPPAPKFWDGSAWQNITKPSGLVPSPPTSISTNNATGAASSLSGNTVTFESVYAVRLDGCFTEDHDNYRVALTLRGSTSGDLNMRLRWNGQAWTTTYYTSGLSLDSNPPTPVSTSNNLWQKLVVVGIYDSALSIDFFRPKQEGSTHFISSAMTNTTYRPVGGYNNTNRDFDGFEISTTVPGLTLAGQMSVYGYTP